VTERSAAEQAEPVRHDGQGWLQIVEDEPLKILTNSWSAAAVLLIRSYETKL
jgi:hypothetical protein